MDVLNLKIATKRRKVRVNDIRQIVVDMKGRESTKVVFEVTDECTGNKFQVSDAWINTSRNFQIKGLWLTLQNDKSEISTASTLAEVMKYYNTDTLKQLINKEVYVHPDAENYLVLLACELPESL